MSNFFVILKKNHKNKYQRWLPNNKFINERSVHLKKLLNVKTLRKISYPKKKFRSSSIDTYKFLKNFNPNKASSEEKKIILSFFKKYNQSLKLKKKYNHKIYKNSDIDTTYSSYIYLGYHISKLDCFTDLQKLNCILKINDITLLNIKSKNFNDLIPYIKKNIQFEINKTIKYAKKSINNSC